jgi:hypothetical protein
MKWEESLMWPAMLLVPTLLAIAMMSGVRLTMAADHAIQRATGQKPQQEQAAQQRRPALAQSAAALAGDPDAVGQHTHRLVDFTPTVPGDFDSQLSARMGLSSWRQPEGPAPFSLFPEPPAGKSEGGTEELSLIEDELGVADNGNAAPRALERDWRGLGRDTAFFLGYQGLAAGVWFLTPESVSKWTPEQRKTSMRRWWENVQHPVWDKDHWYVNYLGHPYFGAIA